MRRGLLQEYASAFSFFSRVLDVFGVVFAGWIAYLLRFFGASQAFDPYAGLLFLAAVITFLLFPFFGVYDSWRGRSLFSLLRRLFFAWCVVIIFVLILSIGFKTITVYSRLWIFYWAGLGTFFLLSLRSGLHLALRSFRNRGWNQRSIVLIGERKLAEYVSKRLKQTTWAGLTVQCIITKDVSKEQKNADGLSLYPFNESVIPFIQGLNIDEVWVTLPIQSPLIKEWIDPLRYLSVPIRFIPDVSANFLFRYPITEISGMPVIEVSRAPFVGVNGCLKLLEDYLLGALFFVPALPFMLFAAIGIKCSSKGPVLFRQWRHGAKGKPILVYKFRTMHVHREQQGVVTQAKKTDERIFPFGAFLRRTSLDELPQLINVLQGRMSLVGPRPHAVEHNEYYKTLVFDYMQRHKVKPGITGWAQVNGFRGETDTLEKMEKRVQYDLYYIDHWSVGLDLKIILLTFFKGLFSKNAY